MTTEVKSFQSIILESQSSLIVSSGWIPSSTGFIIETIKQHEWLLIYSKSKCGWTFDIYNWKLIVCHTTGGLGNRICTFAAKIDTLHWPSTKSRVTRFCTSQQILNSSFVSQISRHTCNHLMQGLSIVSKHTTEGSFAYKQWIWTRQDRMISIK